MGSIYDSPLVALDKHRIDVIFPRTTISITLIDSIFGRDLISIIRSRQISNYVICRNSKSGDFYDILYCDVADQMIYQLIDRTYDFANSKLSSCLVANTNVTTKHQRMALFVFNIYQFKEMLMLRTATIENYNTNPQNLILRPMLNKRVMFRKSDKKLFLIRLPSSLVIKIKCPLTETVQGLISRAYNKMREIYFESEIKTINFYKIVTNEGELSPLKMIKDDIVILKALKAQYYTNQPQLFLKQDSVHSGFDNMVNELTRELDLNNIALNEEIICFNSVCSTLRKTVGSYDESKVQNEIISKYLEVSETTPALPPSLNLSPINFTIQAYLKINNCPTQQQPYTISVGCNQTANDVIRGILENIRLKSKIQFSSPNINPSNEFGGDGSSMNLPTIHRHQNSHGQQSNPMIQPQQDLTRNRANTVSFASLPSNLLGSSQFAQQSSNQIHNSPPPYNPLNSSLQPLQQLDNSNSVLKPPASLVPPVINQNNSFPPSDQASNAFNAPSILPFSKPGAIGSLTKVNQIHPPVPAQISQSPNLPQIPQNSQNSETNNQINWNDPSMFALLISTPNKTILLANDIPLTSFVYIRELILKQCLTINMILVLKSQFIQNNPTLQATQNAYKKQLNSNSEDNLGEISQESLFKPLTVTCSNNPKKHGFIASTQADKFLKVHIHSFANLNEQKEAIFFARVCLVYGQKVLCQPSCTKKVIGKDSVVFNQALDIILDIKNIPREARISITLYKEPLIQNSNAEPVATLNHALYTFTGWLDCDPQAKVMWRNKDMDLSLTTYESRDVVPLYVLFKISSYRIPIAFIPLPQPKDFKTRATASVPASERSRIERLIKLDPLSSITNEDKKSLWNYRTFCFMYPELLPLMLDSINYSEPEQVREIPLLLNKWARPSPLLALTLLDAKFANTFVREYAVECIEDFTEEELMLYLLQIIQALKYELYEDSALARLLIRRGLSDPKFLGHQLFWQLMSEAHLSHIRIRFSIVLLNFMYGVGSYRNPLIQGFKFTQELVKLNSLISSVPYNAVQIPFHETLQTIKIPKEFHLPLNPKLVVESLIIEECKVMNSKKRPFWLVFKNANRQSPNQKIYTMFKVGDDLRQDQLILQLLKVMNHMWKEKEKDYRMNCYSVLPTGLNQGFIEVVPNSVTEAALQQEKGTFNKQIYIKFLRQYNPTDEQFAIAKENFLYSSVGYAVATCVLGVADRHPGNIMIQQDGHFFHIDYGHFLGNFKTKNGIQCEDAPFHFIGAYVELLGGKKSFEYLKFLGEATNALNILRRNARSLITLLLLMTGTGIPELQKREDIYYLRDKLFLNVSDEEISKKFQELTETSLKSWKTLIKAKVHNALTK